MNIKILKTVTLAIAAVFLLVLSSCVKTREGYTDFSQTSDFVILTGAGIGNFKASNIQVNTASSDTIRETVTVDLASKNDNNGPVTVTLGVDSSQIASYNTSNGTHYQAFPANAFKLISNQVTVPAGQHYGTTTVEIYQNKLDPTISYMLPISITNGGGKSLSSNQNTIYYNVIGNPIAGAYTREWQRWNNATGSGSPTFDQTASVVFAPVNPTTISVDSGTGVTYLVSFTNNNGVFSNFQVAFDPASVTTAGITITSGPTIQLADPVNGKYQFTFNYNNSAGSARVIIDKFSK